MEARDICFETFKKFAAHGFHGVPVPDPILRQLEKAASYWQSGDQALALIHVAQSGLRQSDVKAIGEVLLKDAQASASEKGQVFGESLAKAGYNFDEPRIPAGNGKESGDWTSDGDGSAAALVEGRSAAGYVGEPHHVRAVPDDAIEVTRPNGRVVVDPTSPTGKLMAPPRANFREIYAAGQKLSSHWTFLQDIYPAKAALEHFGTFDFQRDKATNTFYEQYVHASNYAIGVYMNGAGYGIVTTMDIARDYALLFSSNRFSSEGRAWIARGWVDADKGYWR